MPAVLAAQQNDDLRTDPPRQNHATNRKLGEHPRPRPLLEAAEPIERKDTNFVRLPSIPAPNHTDNRRMRGARARLLIETIEKRGEHGLHYAKTSKSMSRPLGARGANLRYLCGKTDDGHLSEI